LKSELIRLALQCNALTFGEFTLKSGRISPYFFNAGLFYTGESLRQLGKFYAKTLINQNINFQHLFGPAYKGLPLATATAVALAELNINTTVTFNRKEIKDHGEGGQLIGAPLSGNTVIIDDVITAGTAFREAYQLIHHAGGQVAAVVIMLDRCERGKTNQSTLAEIESQGVRVLAMMTLFDIIEYLSNQQEYALVQRLQNYQEQYGCA
jgi:orotate phosphoribosyltransferase